MDLYLMRHAEAAHLGGGITSDHERPLTELGTKQARAIAMQLHERGARIERIVSSPLRRTMETAQAVAAEFGIADVLPSDILLPMGEPPDIRPFVDSSRNSGVVLIVGHHPDISLLANAMGAPGISFNPGAVAYFADDEYQSGKREYRYLLSPHELMLG